jgi:hypothetical protein
VIKECLVVLHNYLVSEFRNVIAISIANKEAHLSQNTVTRRAEYVDSAFA